MNVYEGQLFDRKIRLYDTQGLNDTDGTPNSSVIKHIKTQFTNKNSTQQLDAVWFVMKANDNRLKVPGFYTDFQRAFGFEPSLMATIIITHCDLVMLPGDYA